MDLTYGQNWEKANASSILVGKCMRKFLREGYRRRTLRWVRYEIGMWSKLDQVRIRWQPLAFTLNLRILLPQCYAEKYRFSKVSDRLVQQIGVTSPTCGSSRSKSKSPLRIRSNYVGASCITTVHRTDSTTTSSSAGR